MRSGKYTVKFEPKYGLNGQLRVIESTACATCFGVTFAYQMDDATSADYWYYWVTDNTGNVGESTYVEQSDTSSSMQLKGRQRNTLGAYMIVNKNLEQLEIWGYDTTATGTFQLYKTTDAEASVQYLGSHEVYWFPHRELLMAKLSDGNSFRFYRLASNFRDIADDDSTEPASNKFDSGEFRLFHLPGRLMVPPIFWG